MAYTEHLIGQAGLNEVNGISNGYNGDQTGWEINARLWYRHINPNWKYVYRIPQYSEKIAEQMRLCVNNGFIGYSNDERDSIIINLLGAGKDMSQINSPCSGDCSSITYAIIYTLTGIKFDNSQESHNSICPYVREFDYYLMNQLVSHGITVNRYEDKSYLISSDLLLPGDIIITDSPNANAHMGIWI